MNFHIMTLFPEMVEQGLTTSILGRAVEHNLITIDAVNIRDYTDDLKHRKVDDYTYGGGAGMLMQAQPIYDCWKAIESKIPGLHRRILDFKGLANGYYIVRVNSSTTSKSVRIIVMNQID